MKVVLFCGGYGMRMRNGTADDLPKPMHTVGPRPLLWHVMRYYAHFGHTEFILCLGYGAQHIKNFFLNYAETDSNDFVLRDGTVRLRSTDISGWSIEFVHTGLDSSIGERLRRVRHLLTDEEVFLANYADVLTDAPLDDLVGRFESSCAAAAMLVVPPQSSFHCVELGARSMVSAISPVSNLPIWENGGYFVLTQEIFARLPEGGDLVDDACGELAKRGELFAYPYRGFWQPADTAKERAALEASYFTGDRPWMLWEGAQTGTPAGQRASVGIER
ncbi:glycosyltransferase family protein [Actinoalloteichus hymeniacidonis]|uniref:Nucleoside-diphosphate-sugar pyrophosphorylase family protein n=1 Tax=Actinoalloteichus hymeniacidonis TaxID=340345 RepID=A0AAC9N0S5_9PSEU|nr:glucose-1-phosphate cytidylyltransferase [Actinoalloteichus hymeniacidonis]AOS65909.1 Nucleoside-diphosphate-sugar pyrophosphorylase family protein [Actinoalloteichus hymeniacidonis]MBB5905995.1 glucose-1-phosphate cytidylyltransferase [Actinoalloteichus hymeniacidonis]